MDFIKKRTDGAIVLSIDDYYDYLSGTESNTHGSQPKGYRAKKVFFLLGGIVFFLWIINPFQYNTSKNRTRSHSFESFDNVDVAGASKLNEFMQNVRSILHRPYSQEELHSSEKYHSHYPYYSNQQKYPKPLTYVDQDSEYTTDQQKFITSEKLPSESNTSPEWESAHRYFPAHHRFHSHSEHDSVRYHNHQQDAKRIRHSEIISVGRQQELSGSSVDTPNYTGSSIFVFSPEQFQNANIISRGFFYGNNSINIIKSNSLDLNETNVKINVTVYTEEDSDEEQVQISSIKEDGLYSLHINRLFSLQKSSYHHRLSNDLSSRPHHQQHRHSRHNFHHYPSNHHQQSRRGHSNDNYYSRFKSAIRYYTKYRGGNQRVHKHSQVSYTIDIIFPANMGSFGNFNVYAKNGGKVRGQNLEALAFRHLKIGVDKGSIKLKGLQAERITLTAFHGEVEGVYSPSQSLMAGVVEGYTDIISLPANTTSSINYTVRTLKGHATLQLPSNAFKGDFTVLQKEYERPPIVTATDLKDLHLTETSPSAVDGYFKETDTNAYAFVHCQHGQAALVFK